MHGLNRAQAAEWASQIARLPIKPPHLQYWEKTGLLRIQRPGRSNPATYRVEDLVRLRLVAELRRQGTQARRIRRAVKQVAASFPAHREAPVCRRLAVTGLGDVVRVRGGHDLVKLSRGLGVSGWLFLLDARRYREDAERAIAEYRARAR